MSLPSAADDEGVNSQRSKKILAFVRGLNIFDKNRILKKDLVSLLKSLDASNLRYVNIVCRPVNSGNLVLTKHSNVTNAEVEKILIRALQSKFLHIKAIAVEDAETVSESLGKSYQCARKSCVKVNPATWSARIEPYDWSLGIVFQSVSTEVNLLDQLVTPAENAVVKVLGGDQRHLFILKKENRKREPRISWGHASGVVESMIRGSQPVLLTSRSCGVVEATLT
jgi:uncharacterized protein (DUF1697 family)